MAENVVEILVKSRDKTKAGFTDAVVASEVAASKMQAIWDKHGKEINKGLAGIGKVAGGTAAAGGIFAIGSAALAAAGPLGALTLAVGAFGAVAVPELSKVHAAMTKTGTAGQKAWAQLTPDQKMLGNAMKGVQASFAQLTKTLAPVVDQVVALGARTLKDALPALGKLATAGGQVLTSFLKPLDAFFKSKVFAQIIDQFSQFAVQAGKLAGPVLTQLLKVFLQLFVQLMPSGLKILQLLLPALVQMVLDLTPMIVVVAKVTAVVLQWLSANKLLVPVLFGVLIAFTAMKVGVVAGLQAIGKAIFAAMGPWGLLAAAVLVAALLIIKYHRQIWDFIQRTWRDVKTFVIRISDDILTFARQWWPLLLGPGGVVAKYHNQILGFIRNIWGTIKRDIASAWNSTWNNTVSRVARGVSDVVGWVRGLPGKITGAVGKAASVLTSWGSGVITGLLHGMTSVIGDVWTFIKGIPGKILKFLHINSPPDWAIEAGKHIMNGFGIGMTKAKDILGKAVTASTSQFSSQALAGSVGGGVERWRSTVLKALRMEGLSSQLVDAVLYQMQTESGGRVNAINLTDSNAARGTPSKGLLQVIDPTFRAYHWPGTSGNIYDPLANIAAAINYARHNYGPGLRNAYGGIGTGHGYAAGGPASGWSWVGEHGRELLHLPIGSQVRSHADSMGMGGGGIAAIQLEIAGGGQSAFDQMMIKWMRHHTRILGGGSAQKAWGRT